MWSHSSRRSNSNKSFPQWIHIGWDFHINSLETKNKNSKQRIVDIIGDGKGVLNEDYQNI